MLLVHTLPKKDFASWGSNMPGSAKHQCADGNHEVCLCIQKDS